jgi:hypothetical protein
LLGAKPSLSRGRPHGFCRAALLVPWHACSQSNWKCYYTCKRSSRVFSSPRALHFSPRGGGTERRGDGCQLPRADQCTLQEESRDPGDASSSPDHSNLPSCFWNLDSFFVGKKFL